jgi:hypothetical protein
MGPERLRRLVLCATAVAATTGALAGAAIGASSDPAPTVRQSAPRHHTSGPVHGYAAGGVSFECRAGKGSHAREKAARRAATVKY